MNRHHHATRALSALLLAAIAHSAHAWQYTVLTDFYAKGVYDENVVQSNRVDREAAGNPKPLAEFAQEVAKAYEKGNGGVCTWDDVAGWIYDSGTGVFTYYHGFGYGSSGRCGNHIVDPADTDYHGTAKIWLGADRAKFVEFLPNDFSDVWSVYYEGYGGTIGRAISGPSTRFNGDILYPNGGGAGFGPHGYEPSWGRDEPGTLCVLRFLQPQDRRDPGIAAIGFTANCSTVARRWEAYVTYDDGSTSEHRIENVAVTEADQSGYLFQDDVFFLFVAPPNRTIAQLRWETDQPGSMIDDLALVLDLYRPRGMVLSVR